MILESISVGPFQSNCYILGCAETREALLVDPGDEPERILRRLERHALTPVAHFHTHGHLDHVGATATLKGRFGGRILLHRADLFLYEHAREQAVVYGIEIPDTLPVDAFVEEGDEIAWGRHQGRVRHTPGHSPGGICLLVPGDGKEEDRVFTGDTLFAGSIGRTDLPGGSLSQLMRSIREKLLALPDATVVASGHGPLSTIGEERRTNPFLQGGW